MRYFILLFALCFLNITAANATPITPEQGAVFLKSCLNTPDPRLLPGSQAVFCQCSTQHLVKNMTFEDAQAYVKNDRNAINKYLITAYAPCMEVPVHDDVYQECVKQKVPHAQCQCLSSGIGKYTSAEAQRLLGGVLSKYPNAFDPIAAIKQTPEFEAQLDQIAKQCANTAR